MNLEAIQAQARSAKQNYWRRLTKLRPEQGELLLPFARESFRDEVERSNQIDTKGQWVLVASLALLGTLSIAGREILKAPDSSAWVAAGIVFALVLFAVSAGLAILGTRIRTMFFTTTPEIALTPSVLDSTKDVDLQRHLILHYLDLRESNAAVSDRRADMVSRAQSVLTVGVVIASAAFLLRVVL